MQIIKSKSRGRVSTHAPVLRDIDPRRPQALGIEQETVLAWACDRTRGSTIILAIIANKVIPASRLKPHRFLSARSLLQRQPVSPDPEAEFDSERPWLVNQDVQVAELPKC